MCCNAHILHVIKMCFVKQVWDSRILLLLRHVYLESSNLCIFNGALVSINHTHDLWVWGCKLKWLSRTYVLIVILLGSINCTETLLCSTVPLSKNNILFITVIITEDNTSLLVCLPTFMLDWHIEVISKRKVRWRTHMTHMAACFGRLLYSSTWMFQWSHLIHTHTHTMALPGSRFQTCWHTLS
jgi:hypothetical protein